VIDWSSCRDLQCRLSSKSSVFRKVQRKQSNLVARHELL
jgi:hypothetical protein